MQFKVLQKDLDMSKENAITVVVIELLPIPPKLSIDSLGSVGAGLLRSLSKIISAGDLFSRRVAVAMSFINEILMK